LAAARALLCAQHQKLNIKHGVRQRGSSNATDALHHNIKCQQAGGKLAAHKNTRLTAGLKCAPDTGPNMVIIT
jgi:hypothetical protein